MILEEHREPLAIDRGPSPVPEPHGEQSRVCLICLAAGKGAGNLRKLYSEIADYEYGVEREATYYECADCRFVMQFPPVKPADIPDLYPDDYQTYTKPGRSLFSILKRILIEKDARKILEIGGQAEPRILEVGCGNGVLLECLHKLRPVSYLCGVDIQDLGIGTNPNIDFRLGQLEEIEMPDASFDVIYCSNLIEHVADPLGFIDRARSLLRPGGYLMIVTPNHRSIDRFVFGRRWGGYHFPRHLTLFNDRNICEALLAKGLSVEAISGGHAWWAISLRNCLFEQSARRKRGLAFALTSLALGLIDLAVNLFRTHGSMTAIAVRV